MCPACTYLNWPRANRCVQCYLKKDSDNLNNVNEQFKSLNIYGSDPELRGKKNSPYSSITNLSKSGADARVSPIENRACAIPSKWTCNVSIYSFISKIQI